MVREISEGSFGKTCLVQTKSRKAEYLMKTCDIRHITKDKRLQLVNEVNILKSLDHPNIPKYRESFIQDKLLN